MKWLGWITAILLILATAGYFALRWFLHEFAPVFS